MIEIVGFVQWHRDSLYDILRKRTPATRSQPIRLLYVSHFSDPVVSLGDRWTRFVAAVGARASGTWWQRVLEAAGSSGVPGVVRDSRSSFGARTLWRDGDEVDQQTGEYVYDALLASGLAREIGSLDAAEIHTLAREVPAAPAAGQAARPAARRAARSPAGPAGRPAAGPPARRAAAPAAESAADPAADQAARPASPVVVVGVVEDEAPPLPSPGGEGSGKAASPPTANVPQPLTAGEEAVAGVLRRALDNAKLRVETPDEAAARLRAARFAGASGPDQARAAAELERLRNAERERRAEAIAALVGNDPAAAREWIRRLEHEEPVRVACLAARKAARADERDRRRDARNGAHVDLAPAGAGA